MRSARKAYLIEPEEADSRKWVSKSSSKYKKLSKNSLYQNNGSLSWRVC